MQQVLIHLILVKICKSHVDKLDIDKLKNVANNLSNLKSKVYNIDTGKFKLLQLI